MSEFEEGLKQLGWTNKKAGEVLQKDAKTIYRWRKRGAPLIVMLLMSVLVERQKKPIDKSGEMPDTEFIK